MKLMFLCKKDMPLDKSRKALKGQIVMLTASEAALYSAGGFGRVIQDKDLEPSPEAKRAREDRRRKVQAMVRAKKAEAEKAAGGPAPAPAVEPEE